MKKVAIEFAILVELLFAGGVHTAFGLKGGHNTDPLEPCASSRRAPMSEAERALSHGQFADAERFFALMPVSEDSVVGQLRAKIGQQQMSSALALALRATSEHPQSALLMDGLAEVRFSRGEAIEALTDFNKAIVLNPCLARAHYDLSLYLDLSGMAASAQKELDLAYRIAPTDMLIRRVWKATQEPIPTPDSQIADLREIESRPNETDGRRVEIESVIKALEADKKGDCELISNTASATIPLVPLFADGKQMPPTASALDVVLNGKKRQLLLDSGGTGLTISREAAAGLGLVSEADVTSSGVGNDGSSSEFIAHLDRMKIGALEFRNCKVRVQAKPHGLDVQGLFGVNVLQSLLITLDFPGQKLRTAALPALNQDGERAPESIAKGKKDGYVPPGMEDWIPIFRKAQYIMVSTSIGNVPRKLFILDTGAQDGLIATEVAREVTTITSRPGDSLRGLNGVTRNVSVAGPITVEFLGFKAQVKEMTALDDLSGFSPDSEVRIPGFIGYDVLRNLVIAIDYRDNLVKVTQALLLP